MSRTLRVADGDIFINSAGRGEGIEGPDKCAQDLAEILMTPFDALRDYGSELATLNIPEPISTFAGKSIISKKVDEAVQRLKRLQEKDPYAGADEIIDKINRLVVQKIDVSQYLFWVNVFLYDQTVIGNLILGVSLRHQESARLVESAEEIINRLR